MCSFVVYTYGNCQIKLTEFLMMVINEDYRTIGTISFADSSLEMFPPEIAVSVSRKM